MGAVQFIENMDRTSLTISDEDFEKNVEAAVSAIAEKHRAEETSTPSQTQPSEKAGGLQPPFSSSSARPSLDIEGPATPRRSLSNDGNESNDDAVAGLLRTIRQPLSTIGRIFSDEPSPGPSGAAGPAGPSSPARTPQPAEANAGSRLAPRPSVDRRSSVENRQLLSAQEAAARQASAEVAEAQRLQRAEHHNVVETLAGMFPDLDRDIISDVVYQKEGRFVQLSSIAIILLSSLTTLPCLLS
jgi:Rab5 GDP/GTP exchange factor